MNHWLGRTAPLAFLVVVACGGNVVIDHEGSSTGTSTQHGSSTTTHPSTTTHTTNSGPGTGGFGGFSTTTNTTSFDGPGGFGGHTTSHVVSTGDVNPVGTSGSVFPDGSTGFGGSTVTGMVCDCNTVCNDVSACGIPGGGQCMQLCSRAPQQVLDCICNTFPNCSGLQQCFNFGTGPGPSSAIAVTSTTGSGMGGGNPGGVSQQCRTCSNNSLSGACSMEAFDCQGNPDCTALLTCNSGCGWTDACRQQCLTQNPNGEATFEAAITCAVCDNCAMDCSSSQIFTTYCGPQTTGAARN